MNAKAGLGKAGQNGAPSPLPDEVKEDSPQWKAYLTTTQQLVLQSELLNQGEQTWLGLPPSRPHLVCFPESRNTKQLSSPPRAQEC